MHILRKRKFDRITSDLRDQLHWLLVQQRIEYCVELCAYTRQHQAASLKYAHRCLCLSTEIISVLQRTSTLYPRSRTMRYRQRRFAISAGLGPRETHCRLPCVTHQSITDTDSVLCSLLLKIVPFCTAYEPPLLRLHDSSGCKDCCANMYVFLLTYLLSGTCER